MPSDAVTPNSFTRGPLGAIFARTALPIIFVMSMNGLLAVVDAIYLGVFVGPDALGAVTLVFPFYMLIVALATLIGSGMSSLLARHLGAGRYDDARGVFAGAHGLALSVSAVLVVLYLVFGRAVMLLAAGGNEVLAGMGQTYLGITVTFSPVLFVLSVNSDALRNEGRAGLMAAMSLLVSLANIGFNSVLIAGMGWGVAGSAYGTVMAQGLALAIILAFRLRGRTVLKPGVLRRFSPSTGWRRILELGTPQSLSFLGMALTSAVVIASLQMVDSGTYDTTVSAYGIITRIMTFVFLPLLGLSHALQAIAGNNFGAELWRRSDDSLRLGLMIALVYSLGAETLLVSFAHPVGRLFVDDNNVADEVARIMPVMFTMFFTAGPMVMLATYFQAIGDAGRAAVLSLPKPYLFAIPMTFLLPIFFGEAGIWMAIPTADVLMLALAAAVLAATARRGDLRWGVFKAAGGQSARDQLAPAALRSAVDDNDERGP